jgi:hypothetical protein
MIWLWRTLRRSDEIDDLRNQLAFSEGNVISLKKKLCEFLASNGSEVAKEYIRHTEGKDWDEKYGKVKKVDSELEEVG